jgi:YD repeat-containing protein
VYKSGGGTVLADYGYGYDAGDRLTAETDNPGTTTAGYGYDAANQLTAVTGTGGTGYGYDLAGNRSGVGSTAYQVGGQNLLQSDGAYSYSYDAENNRTSKAVVQGVGTWTYDYDQADHLIAARQTAGGSESITEVYDALGQRVQEVVNGVTTEFVVVDGEVWADLTGANGLQTRYVRPDGTDALGARLTGGQTYWYVTDRLG